MEIVIDGLPEELQPKEDKARQRNQGIADILGNNGKESGQREDMVREYLEAMQRAVESGKFGEEKNAQGGLETAEIKADEDLAVDGLLEPMQRAVEGARPGEEWVVQDEPDTLEIKADEETRPLEPEGIVSAEFSYQEPCAGLPDKPPEDEPGREALLSGDEAIVLGAPELPEALAEDRRERTWSPGAQPAIGMSAARVEPSAALTSLDPLEPAEVAIAAGEENEFESHCLLLILLKRELEISKPACLSRPSRRQMGKPQSLAWVRLTVFVIALQLTPFGGSGAA